MSSRRSERAVRGVGRYMHAVAALATLNLLLAGMWQPPASAQQPGDFDSYVLALSWSPSFCASPEGRDAKPQCAPGRSYDFVVHGLWPQDGKAWPEFCRTSEPWVAEETIRTMLEIMPSRRLIIHQWRKHGSCSGLAQRDYFEAIRALRSRITVPARYAAPRRPILTSPEELKAGFLRANDWMRDSMLHVTCGNRRDRGRLADLRLCLTREFEPRACGASARRACRARQLAMPPAR